MTEPMSIQPHTNSPRSEPEPFVGPRPFTEKESVYFYGRDLESQQLTSLIIAHRIVLFYAQSGAGKTSLLRASVVPALEAKHVVVLPIVRVMANLAKPTNSAGIDNIFVASTLINLAGETSSPVPQDQITLAQGLAPYILTQGSTGWIAPRLLILDQFEEIFTQQGEWAHARADFFNQLQECLATYPQLGIVLAMREDYIAQMDKFAALFVDRLRIRYRIEPLAYTGALAAVKQPAALANRPFEPEVAETLVKQLSHVRHFVDSPEIQGTSQAVQPIPDSERYIEPVYLQIVCKELWDKTQGKHSISNHDLEKFGDVDQALTNFYEGAIRKVLAETDVNERTLRDWVNKRLITPARTRGLVYQGQQETEGLPNAAVALLDKVYIIRPETRGVDRWYELAHDRLVEPILRANTRWLSQHESPFADAAHRWRDAERDPARLLSGSALADAEDFAARNPGALDEWERKFLAASQASAVTAQQKLQRRWFGTFALLAVVAILALWGWRNAVNAEAIAAQEATNAAIAQSLAAQAEEAAIQARAAEAEAQTARAAADSAQARAVIILNTSVAQEADRVAEATQQAEQPPTPTTTTTATATPTTKATQTATPPRVATPAEIFAPATADIAEGIDFTTPESGSAVAHGESVIDDMPEIITGIITETGIIFADTPLPTAIVVTLEIPETPVPAATATPEPLTATPEPLLEGLEPPPFRYGVVASFGGARGDFLLRDPYNELSGIIWVPVGTPLTLLGAGKGTEVYGSGDWYFVEIVGLVKQPLQGWLPAEIITPDEARS